MAQPNETRPAGAGSGLIAASKTSVAQHEPSAWLRGAVAKRVRQINAAVADVKAFGAIVAPLGRTGPPGSRADRECDRCGRYVPCGDLLYLFAFAATPRIHLAGGLCGRCEATEVGR